MMPLLKILILSSALALAFFIGMRFTLARQRWREVRIGLIRQQTAESMEATFHAVLRQREAAIERKLKDHLRLFNASLFVLMWNWDLLLILDQLRSVPEVWSVEKGWRKKLAARQLALVCYEALIKVHGIFDATENRQWSVRRAVRNFKLDSELDPVLDRAHGQVSVFLAAHGALLGGIRNNVIGHRDLDVGSQLDWMKKTDMTKLEALGWESLGLVNELLGALSEVARVVKVKAA